MPAEASSDASAARSRSEPGRVSTAPAGRVPATWLVAMGTWGYVSGIHGSVAPFIAHAFGLDDAAMARLWILVGLSSLAALALGRQADRWGRRRVLLGSFALLPLAALAVAAAPGPGSYVAAQMAAWAAGGTLLATATVAIAEGVPDGLRARAQGRAGLAFAAASALPLAGVAFLGRHPDGWRAIWAASGLALLALPWMAHRLPETASWRRASASGRARAARLGDVFGAAHRRRTLPLAVALLGVHTVELAARAWLLYHPVRALGLPPGRATLLLAGCGGLGLLGFRAGGRLADRLGRRLTFALAGTLFAACTIGYYEGTLVVERGRTALLAGSLLGLSAGGNAALVAFRSLAVELYPTSLRGTFAGWMAVGQAAGWVLGMGAVALLAGPLGGVGPAVAALAGVALPIAVAALACVPETAGRPLDEEDGAPGAGPVAVSRA